MLSDAPLRSAAIAAPAALWHSTAPLWVLKAEAVVRGRKYLR